LAVSLHFWNQFDTHHVGVWKKFFWAPLMCMYKFLGPFPEAHGWSKNFFCRFRLFYIKMKLSQGNRYQNKIFIKNQLTLQHIKYIRITLITTVNSCAVSVILCSRKMLSPKKIKTEKNKKYISIPIQILDKKGLGLHI
jgi:hypothetical protein